MRVVAGFLRKVKPTRKHGPGFEFNRVAATGIVNCRLEIVGCMYGHDFAWGWRVRKGASHVNTRQFCWAVKLALLGERERCEDAA
jgi:hypothetical protein